MKNIVFLITLFILGISDTFACSCILPETPKASLEKSNYVFIGEVTNIKDIGILEGNFFGVREKEITFEIDDIIKGGYQEKIKIKTAGDTAACGYDFKENKSYFVYTNGELGKLKVSLCSRTNLLANAGEDIEAFKDILFKKEGNFGNNKNISSNSNETLRIYVTIFLSVILIFLSVLLYITKKR